MKKLIYSIFFILLCSHFISFSQSQIYYTNIPTSFILSEYNNLIFKAILNRKDTLSLMLHTASANVILTDSAVSKIKTLQKNGQIDNTQSWGGNGNISSYSLHNHLTMGNFHWDDISVWTDKNSGYFTDGKFGLNLFENQIVEINFDKRILIVWNALPQNISEYTKCKISFRDNEMYLTAGSKIKNKIIENEFLIHSGYSGGILFDDKFSNENNLEKILVLTDEKKLSDAYGNIIKVQKAILPSFTLGKEDLKNVPVGFFSGTIGTQQISVLGADILKRFNWIIDAERKYIYLKKNTLFDESYFNK